MEKRNKDLLIFGCIWALIALAFAVLGVLNHGWAWPQVVKAVCAVVFAVAAFLMPGAFSLGYELQMKLAHFIGGVITPLLFSVIFFLVFAPVGIFLRLAGKDHLNRRWGPSKESYWRVREGGGRAKETYLQQF
jgi:hypothetical protein